MAVSSAAPARAADGQRRLARVEALGELAVALDEERVQAEDLHFLRRLDAGPGLAHVVELAPLRRPRVVERVALGVEVRLAEERGHEGEHEQRDEPGRVHGEAGGEARDGHHVLGLAEDLAHAASCGPWSGGARGRAGPAARLSSKSSRSRVAACSMSRMLVVLEKRSESSASMSETTRPSTSESDGQPELEAEQQQQVVDEPAGEPFAQASCGACPAPASRTTSSMISLPT